jgi:hypothetical protein
MPETASVYLAQKAAEGLITTPLNSFRIKDLGFNFTFKKPALETQLIWFLF